MKISKLYVQQDAADLKVTKDICRRLPTAPKFVDDPDSVYQAIAGSSDPELTGKSVLMLAKNKGAFIRNCPGTSHYTCCGYKILHIGTYCSMDCAYCILQAYFHPPVLQFFVNHEEMEDSLEKHFSSGIISRIGTGEFTDSLIWEDIFPIASRLVELFSRQKACVLELKTKTVAVKQLLGLDHKKKTIMAWSLNTEPVIAAQERKTASLSSRLKAAEQCQARGFPLAFHFDPMILYENCHSDYADVVNRLFSKINPENIVWISLGSFRFMPQLKPIIARRFPDSKIIYHEFVRAIDGKMRYFKPLRIKLYQRIIEAIKAHAPDVLVYFCMEDEEVWSKCFGFTPEIFGGLPAMLDRRAAMVCNLTGKFSTG